MLARASASATPVQNLQDSRRVAMCRRLAGTDNSDFHEESFLDRMNRIYRMQFSFIPFCSFC